MATSAEVETSEMISARRTESIDAPSISKLATPLTEFLFGRVNVINLIEKSLLAVTLSNEVEEILGHAAFLDYPNADGVEPDAWVDWLMSSYELAQCNPLNTLFMHYFVAKQNYSNGCAREIIRTMFNTIPNVHFCLLMVPSGVQPDAALGTVFKAVPKRRLQKNADNPQLFICHRYDHVPVLHIREAKVEDHDDLMPIFSRQTEVLLNTYGEYFVAEMIEAQNEDMKCIVAEVGGYAVGFMSISKDFNVDILNDCFELAPFHGLRKPHPSDEVKRSFAISRSATPVASARTQSDTFERSASVASHVSKAEAEDKEREKEKSTEQILSKGEEEKERSTSQIKLRPLSAIGSVQPVVERRLSESQHSTVSLFSEVELARSVASQLSMTSEKATRQFPKPESRHSTTEEQFVPQYFGENNAFVIQLFCIDEKYEMRSCDFLPKAFELFNDRRYCIITTPFLVPEFPLLQQFMRVTPKLKSTLPQELYVFNSLGLMNNITVRFANHHDLAGVENLVESLELSKNLLADVKQFSNAYRDSDGTEIQVFVAVVADQIVGIAVLRREENIEYIRSHYNIEDFIYFNHHRREEHAHLHHYALNPIFKPYSKFFLKEILRLGNKTSIYYPLYPSYAASKLLEKHSLVAALSDMVPARARRQIDYPMENLGDNIPSERVLKNQEPYALNHINRKLVLEPKVTINARIVVVGASDVGIAFLETFSFCPHLRFNNLILISPHGLPGEMRPNDLRENMRATSHCYNQKDFAYMGLRTWVNVVYGKMTAIDRYKKHVTVNGSSTVPFDYLVLCTGTQYYMPTPTGADVDLGVTNDDLPEKAIRRYEDRLPDNVFLINDSYDAAVALFWIEDNILNTENIIVIYGHSLDAYTCIQTLLSSGVRGDQIILVTPPLGSEVSCFNNPDVEAVINESLTESKVVIYSECVLAHWNYSYNNASHLNSISFTTPSEPVTIDCAACFGYYGKTVDLDAFRVVCVYGAKSLFYAKWLIMAKTGIKEGANILLSINDFPPAIDTPAEHMLYIESSFFMKASSSINCSCLVFDGRLVIDASFHTNDPSIRAAGPLTKYKRIYHADKWTHANFNSKEIGIQLASSMLSIFDPTIEPEEPPTEDQAKLIPTYRSPKLQGAVLPGGYKYLHAEKPKIPSLLSDQMNQKGYGRELITRKSGENIEYFRLHINQYNAVETITCLSKSEYSSSNLLCLYGIHERCLNNLLSRYDEGLIKDFYSYFKESWAMAIYHDRFLDFRDEIRELLTTRPNDDTESLEEMIHTMLDDDLVLTDGQRKVLKDRYVSSGCKQTVETRLLSYLTYNYYHLPMYAKPGMV